MIIYISITQNLFKYIFILTFIQIDLNEITFLLTVYFHFISLTENEQFFFSKKKENQKK